MIPTENEARGGDMKRELHDLPRPAAGPPALATAALFAAALAAGAHAAEPPKNAQSEYGVTLAMSGEQARAESVFVSLLSHSRGDARALNNLGNLRLLKGEIGVALAFYDRALRGDSTDAGIHLNRATALMLLGDEARAQEAAATGVKLAGGVDQAGALLGLKSDNPKEAGKGAEKAVVSKDEIQALLHSAAAAVPSDTSHAAAKAGTAGAAGKKAPTWRSAGPRASDSSDAAVVLYWKR
jgi:tetratricopeptide (TPR) repeat protein